MKYAVRRSTCWLCGESYNPSWIVSDTRGHVSYVATSWIEAVKYAYAATQPGTGVQVQVTERGSNA